MAYAKICVGTCPEQTVVRLADKENIKRRDLCLRHGALIYRYKGQNLDIVDTWNGVTPDDIINWKEDEENE